MRRFATTKTICRIASSVLDYVCPAHSITILRLTAR
jgi:hypothetical protein